MDVDTSLFDVALHNLNYPGTWYLNGGAVTGRTARSGHPSLMPSQLYRTRDGWIFIMCNKEKFWPLLAQELGQPEWIDDPEFAHLRAAREPRARHALLDDALMTQPTAEWIERFSGKVPVSPVFDVAQALENAFVHERDGVLDFDYPEGAQRAHDRQSDPDAGVGCRTARRRAWASTTKHAARGRLRRGAIARLRELGVIAGASGRARCGAGHRTRRRSVSVNQSGGAESDAA